MPTPLTADRLAALPGIAHGFFTRHGGVSQGGYASLNCGLGSKDDPAAVRENRARVAAALSAQEPHHGAPGAQRDRRHRRASLELRGAAARRRHRHGHAAAWPSAC